MSALVIVKEIAFWALTHHMDDVGDHLDLSDHELAKALAWLRVDFKIDRFGSEDGGDKVPVTQEDYEF